MRHSCVTTVAAVRATTASPLLALSRRTPRRRKAHSSPRRGGRDRQVDLLDRDTLWTFAQGFGLVYERAVLLERLRSQRDQVRQMVSATDVVMNALCDAEIRLDNASSGEAVVARTAASLFVAPESRIESLLTRRELEVLALMSRGATNSAIAGDLVISEGTVKSHVKHILRKLRAANRAEAVSRYLRFYIGNEPDPDS